MPMEEGFYPAHPLPLVSADQGEQQEIGNARHAAVASPRLLKVSALAATVIAAAIAVTVMSVGNPLTPDAEVTASLAANSNLAPDTDRSTQSTPKIQSTVDAAAVAQPAADPPASPPTAKDVAAHEEIAAPEPAVKDQAEQNAPTTETLFKQFQAWAAEQDAQPNYRPLVQEAPVQAKRAAETAPAPSRLTQKRRYVRPVQNARAEARTERAEARTERPRKKVRRTPAARAAQPPVEDARTQGQPVQDAQASFLPTFGPRN